MIEDFPNMLEYSHKYVNRAIDVENTVSTAMKSLSSAEFEDVLHPVFKEDEFTLIIVGAVLGLAVGVFQLYFMV